MNILIIEDEQLAQERLLQLIAAYDNTINVVACLESVEESITWMKTKPHPDLILLDIHLSDGHSFEIFKRVGIRKPVIFITAYENYAVEAFKLFSIDYILKPVTAEALSTAINKYKDLSEMYTPADYNQLMEKVKDSFSVNYRTRFLAKVGQRLFFVSAQEVAYFYTENKIVFLINREGNRFVINNTLEKLETELNPQYFFRLNRQIIIHADVIDQIKPYSSNRLKLNLKGIETADGIIISKERVADFKIWADA